MPPRKQGATVAICRMVGGRKCIARRKIGTGRNLIGNDDGHRTRAAHRHQTAGNQYNQIRRSGLDGSLSKWTNRDPTPIRVMPCAMAAATMANLCRDVCASMSHAYPRKCAEFTAPPHRWFCCGVLKPDVIRNGNAHAWRTSSNTATNSICMCCPDPGLSGESNSAGSKYRMSSQFIVAPT